MTEERKVQLGVTVDASGAKQGFDEVKRDAQYMAQSVAQAGTQAGKAVEGIGNGGNASAQKVDAAAKSMIQSIQRTTAVMEAGSRNSSKYFETLAAQRGVDVNILKPYLTQLDSVAEKQKAAEHALNSTNPALQRIGVSAAQTAAAMRQVPAQFTDIVTALQGGQQPMTVLLQQGGQLKDAFGGIGPAAKALAGYVAGLINPFTLAAGAAVALGVAYSQGSKETDAYNKALILSGNVAGETAGHLQSLAQSVSKSIGTQGEAAAVLAEMAGNTKIASAGFEQFTRVALQMEKAVGKSVSETVKELEQLGDAPLASSEKLNKQYHYLSASIYEQIKALQDQGRTEQAAAIAQKAYADAFDDRSKKLLDNLGYAEKAWNGVAGAAKGAWDAMRDIGRPETSDDLLKKVDAQIQNLQNRIAQFKASGVVRMTGYENELSRLQASRSVIQGGNNRAAIRSSDAAIEQRLNDQRIDWDKAAEQSLTRQQQLTRELTSAKTEGVALGLSEEKINERLVSIRKKYSDIFNDGIESQIEAIKRRNQLEDEGLRRSVAQLQVKQQVGAATEENTISAIANAELNAFDRRKAALQQELELTKTKQNSLKEQQALAGEIANLTEQRLTREKQLENDILLLENKRFRQAVDNYQKTYDGVAQEAQKLREQVYAQEDYNETIGMTREGIAAVEAARLRHLAALREEKADVADLVDISGELGDQYREQAKALRDLADKKQIGAQKDAMVDMWRSIDDAAHDAFVHIEDGGKSVIHRLSDSLKSGIYDLLYQLTVKKWILNIGASITGSLGFSQAASAASAMESGGGLLSSASLYSAGKTLWDGFSTGFAGLQSTITGYAQSGINMFGVNTGSYAGIGAAGPSALASSIGAYVPMIAVAVASYLGAKAISNGYKVDGIGNLLNYSGLGGGLINRAFGMRDKETTNFGIEGDFGSNGFVGRNFADWKQEGGWFRSDRSGSDISALDPLMVGTFSTGVDALKSKTADMAESLGLSADSIESYSKHIRLELTKDEAKNQQMIADLFTSIGEELVTKVADFSGFAKAGETSSATMERLSTSLITTNSWLSMLRQRLFQVSLAGADSASKLADAFGGLENLTNASAAFYQTYYTEGERAQRSAEDMAKALAAVNLSMPKTKDELRNMAASLDLNTESGRQAYAVLLSIAPEFANVAAYTAQAAKDTAAKLISAFSAGGALVPVLDAASAGVKTLATDIGATSTVVGYISRLFLDAQSGLISFSVATGGTISLLTDAQRASLQLNDQMDTLRYNARNASIDIGGLSAALEDVNTETFVETVSLIFQNLADRIREVIGDIANERGAVREAALQIINPTVMSKAAIQSSISGINTALPSNAGVVTALNGLNAANGAQAALDAQKANIVAAYAPIVDSNKALYDKSRADAKTSLNQFQSLLSTFQKSGSYYTVGENFDAGQKFEAHGYSTTGDQTAKNNSTYAAYSQAFDTARTALATYTQYSATYNAKMAEIAAQQATITNSINAATAQAKQAQLAYADALQNFAIDASKSVSKLGRLREETLKYYEAQKQLADLMQNSAAGLRKTVSDYRYSQLTPQQQFDSLQTQFSTAYAMALSTDGETLASYGDKLNSLLNPLLEKAREVYGSDSTYNTFAATVISRAEAIASRLETLTPTDYAADSLAMLGQIDATLSALDESSKSAEKLIVDAINASRDQTVGGLHAVVAALTGQSIPAFASGGDHRGGMALVGERGAEIINTGPARIFNAAQTRDILNGGSSAEQAAETRALREQVANLQAALEAIATYTSKTARQLERFEADGMTVKTDADTPLKTEAA